MNADWKRLYEDGATVEEISLEVGADPKYVRRTLVDLGTVMRPKGQRSGTRAKNNTRTDAARSTPGAAVHAMFAGTRGVHRRRGGKRWAGPSTRKKDSA